MDMAEKDESEGRCPACRAPYDKEKIVGMAAKCERFIFSAKPLSCLEMDFYIHLFVMVPNLFLHIQIFQQIGS